MFLDGQERLSEEVLICFVSPHQQKETEKKGEENGHDKMEVEDEEKEVASEAKA